MKIYTVIFTPEAEEQLVKLYTYIEENASAEIALRYTNAIVEHCESLGTLPASGHNTRRRTRRPAHHTI